MGNYSHLKFNFKIQMPERKLRSETGLLNTLQVSPYLGGIGIASGVVSFNVALYYNTIIAWCLNYFVRVSEFNSKPGLGLNALEWDLKLSSD